MQEIIAEMNELREREKGPAIELRLNDREVTFEPNAGASALSSKEQREDPLFRLAFHHRK